MSRPWSSVPSQNVPAGGRLRARRQLAVHHVELREVVRILRRDERARDRRGDEQQEQAEPEHATGFSRKVARDCGAAGFALRAATG
jgi:hypothetical protein